MTVLGLLTTTYGAPSARGGPGIAAAGGGSRGFPQSGGTLSPDPDRSLRSGALYLKHPQDAEDVTQDAFVRIWDTAASYRPQGKPMAWLLTVARNLALMRLRERGKTQELTDEEWSALPARPPDVTTEDRHVLRAALSLLSGAGAAGGHAPCGHRPEAPGDRPAAGAPLPQSCPNTAGP